MQRKFERSSLGKQNIKAKEVYWNRTWPRAGHMDRGFSSRDRK